MREIVFDTETTGFEPAEGHRLVEIGCIEMIDGMVTDNVYHVYINPERDVPADAVAVHGITTEYLRNKDKYVGKLATVKYYERSGVDCVPFHANVITIRNYE